MVMLAGAVADMSGLAVPADVESLWAAQDDINLGGVGDDVGCLAIVVPAGRSAAEQVNDSADDAGVMQSDEPRFKYARTMAKRVGAQDAVVKAANDLGALPVHHTICPAG